MKCMGIRDGLNLSEVKERTEKRGFNEIAKKSKVRWWRVLLDQFKSPLIYVLVIAVMVTWLMNERVDAAVISVAVVVNIILGFFQEFKAEKSLEALASMVAGKVKVKRDGKWDEVEARELVPGDVVRLEIGMKVPADGVLVIEDGMFVSEAILTGESVAVEKKTWTDKGRLKEWLKTEWFDGADKMKRVFMGSVIEKGIGEMLVIRTGDETEMGKIAKKVKGKNKEETPLQKKLGVLSKQLALLVGIVIVVVMMVGLLTGRDFTEMFLTAVALAVAAIPEGLAVSLTVILTIGMGRMLKRKSLVRKLLAVETLGGVNVICLDKTGTITVGKMEAMGGVSDLKIGFKEHIKKSKWVDGSKGDYLLGGAWLCNDLRDPLETAMHDWAEKQKQIKEWKEWKREDELPFDHKYKYIVTRHKNSQGKRLEFLSGAPEVVLDNCNLTKKEKEDWLKEFSKLGVLGYRLVGFGYKKGVKGGKIKRDSVSGYEWCGVVIFEDPVREGVDDLLKRAKKAGIDMKVITGDYKETAWSVLKQVGLVGGKLNEDEIMMGDELAEWEGKEMREEVINKIERVKLFARTTPEQKLLIVDVLQKRGHTVAMTGDGVNDAPALKQADIGIVVNDASDVARETADMVLLDNNFGTVLAAVEEGRGVFDNLKKVLLYLLSDAFAEVMLVLGSIVLGWPLPILAVQILWVNLMSDGLPYLALTVEPKEKGLLSRKPINKKTKILDEEMMVLIGIVSTLAALMVGVAFYYYYFVLGRSIEEARTLVFTMIGVDSLLYVFSLRSLGKMIYEDNLFKNPWLIWGVVGGLIMQVLVVYVPFLQKVFKTVGLDLWEWLMVFGLGLVLVGMIEVVKWIYLKRRKR